MSEYCFFKIQFKTKNNNKFESPNLETWIRQNYSIFKEKKLFNKNRN